MRIGPNLPAKMRGDEVVKMPEVVMDTFNDPHAIKFLATVDSEGTPNTVPIGSLIAVNEEMLAFADMMLNKTKKNLLATGKVAATVYKPPMTAYQVKGTFQGFQTSGPLIEMYNEQEPIRLSAISNVSSVGTIKVEEVYFAQVPFPGRRIA